MPTNMDGLENRPNHQLAMTLLMTPDMANFMGNVHGGTILKLLDQVAYACASRYAGGMWLRCRWIKSPSESQSMSASSLPSSLL
jgi:acyl-CoA hydrolase